MIINKNIRLQNQKVHLNRYLNRFSHQVSDLKIFHRLQFLYFTTFYYCLSQEQPYFICSHHYFPINQSHNDQSSNCVQRTVNSFCLLGLLVSNTILFNRVAQDINYITLSKIILKNMQRKQKQLDQQINSMQSLSKQNIIKVITIGDSSVGKSSIIQRYTDGQFNNKIQSTVYIDYKIKKDINISNKRIGLAIWDTAGQQSFRTMTRSYYKSADGVIIVYDVTQKKSYEAVQSWLDQIQNHGQKNIQKLLVGNKSDLYQKRQVSYEQAYKFAKNNGLEFVQVSALSSSNIALAFQILLKKIIGKREKNLEKKKYEDKYYNLQKKYRNQLKDLKKQQARQKSSCC